MTTVYVATLSAKGYVSDVPNMLDHLMAHFYESENSQSTLYAGKITNLQYLVQQYGGNPDQFTDRMETQLKVYFGRHFPDGAKVVVRHNANEPDFNGVKYAVYIQVQVNRDGQTFSIAEELQAMDGKFEKVRALVNA